MQMPLNTYVWGLRAGPLFSTSKMHILLGVLGGAKNWENEKKDVKNQKWLQLLNHDRQIKSKAIFRRFLV